MITVQSICYRAMLPRIVDEFSLRAHDGRTFGETLFDVLIDLDVSQKELSQRLHLSKAEINRWVNDELPNRFSADDLVSLAEALECTGDQFRVLVQAYLRTLLFEKGLCCLTA
jgi:transcriptional regulator with XRE-family HTH domain